MNIDFRQSPFPGCYRLDIGRFYIVCDLGQFGIGFFLFQDCVIEAAFACFFIGFDFGPKGKEE